MKKSIFAICTLAVMLLLGSCAQEDTLEGTWQATSAKVESAEMNPQMATIVEGEYQLTNLTLLADGTVELKRGEAVLTGTYELDETAKTFKMNAAADAPNPWSEEYTLVSRNGGEMTLTQPIDKKGSTVTVVLQKQAPQEGQ